MAVLCALPILLTLLHAESALGEQGSIFFLRPAETSTLDAQIVPGSNAPPETVLDILGSGTFPGEKKLSAGKKPVFIAPSTEPKKAKPTTAISADQSVGSPHVDWLKATAKKNQTSTGDGPSSSKPDKTFDDKAAEEFLSIARRVDSSTSKPLLPLPKKTSTAVATDLSKPLGENITRPEAKPVKPILEPKPLTSPSAVINRANSAITAKNLPPLTRSQQNLRRKIRNVLTHYYNRPLNTRDRSPWEIMHAMLAFEAHSKVLQGGPQGDPITAVGWLCYNRDCKRRSLMYVNEDDELRVRVGPALQGHRGQLLAMLAQSRINENYPLLVEGKSLTIKDLIEMEKRTCYPRTELTFKLIGLMHYLDSDEQWLNDQGRQWGIPKMISEEMRQPVRGAACGGTHRLSGLTLAYKTRIKRGEPVDGEYLKAQRFVRRYQQYAYRLQNKDGSFSTEWFRGPGDKDDIDRKLKTTGHILEWLLYAATEKELKHWKTTKAANYLANIMYRNRYKDWESGPLGHAVHALLVYDRLVFSPYDVPQNQPMATQPANPRRRR